MPVITQKDPSKNAKSSSRQQPVAQESQTFLGKWAASLISLLAGAILGLSAPGIGLWFTAWFGLAPLLLLIATSETAWIAAWRGLLFGAAYNLVYGNWVLGLYPLDWLGFNAWQGALLAGAAWIILCLHQAILVSLFAGICRLIPMKGIFLPEHNKKSWQAPALLVVPILWLLCVNKLGNAHYFLGVPWTMLEYSQYKQLPIIQVCSIIGGIGLGYLMVMANTSIAITIASFSNLKSNGSFTAPNKVQALNQLLVCGLLVTCSIFYGFWQCLRPHTPATTTASVLQGNINIDMQKTVHRYSLNELLTHYSGLIPQSPPGLCVWTESSVPTYLSRERSTLSYLSSLAKVHHLDMVVGAMDLDNQSKPYNSAYGITSGGGILTTVYHKRYLVPFGEYTPAPVKGFPEWILRLTNTPAGGGFESGKDPVVLNLNCGKVAPLICFETLSPELVASSVRKGAQLLVNVSDLAWFHKSMIGDQMVAFSVLRSVESARYFVFAANTGPSAIIDPTGKINQISGVGKERVVVGKVGFVSETTPFSNWFIF
jgi:apolipoprotein N-acyltransferase